MPTKQDDLDKEFHSEFYGTHAWVREKELKSFIRLRESRLKESWKKEAIEKIEKIIPENDLTVSGFDELSMARWAGMNIVRNKVLVLLKDDKENNKS